MTLVTTIFTDYICEGNKQTILDSVFQG